MRMNSLLWLGGYDKKDIPPHSNFRQQKQQKLSKKVSRLSADSASINNETHALSWTLEESW